jgi:hypothetical protein
MMIRTSQSAYGLLILLSRAKILAGTIGQPQIKSLRLSLWEELPPTFERSYSSDAPMVHTKGYHTHHKLISP